MNNFYSIISRGTTDDVHVITVELNPSHEIYKGHFPSRPVVPGVCTLSIIKECVSGILGCNIVFEEIKECKFVAAIIPGAGTRLEIRIEMPDEGTLRCTVQSEDKIALKLKAVFRKVYA